MKSSGGFTQTCVPNALKELRSEPFATCKRDARMTSDRLTSPIPRYFTDARARDPFNLLYLLKLRLSRNFEVNFIVSCLPFLITR